eukprot:6136530-Amphidinium_carterae.1
MPFLHSDVVCLQHCGSQWPSGYNRTLRATTAQIVNRERFAASLSAVTCLQFSDTVTEGQVAVIAVTGLASIPRCKQMAIRD